MVESGAMVVAEDIDAAVNDLQGRRTITITGDVRKRSTAEEAARCALDNFGCIDILVNNAAVILSKDILETTEEEWDDVMSVNVKGVFHHVRSVLPAMIKRQSGAIINVTSISGVVGLAKQAAYCASKGALVQITRQLSIEYAARGIRVNAVAPGAIDTPFLARHLDAQPDRAKAEADVNNAHPLGRYASPSEIAETIAFLASPQSSFMTGTILMVDGGYTAR
jgi:NAD(P)-dependent dehydrogenase (short-subunit alcohol dehydrogenase family)